MAGYNDSEGPYVSGAAGVFTHLAHMTDITNKFDKDDVPATGYTWVYNSTNGVYRSRALLSTDVPGIVVNSQAGSAYTLVVGDAGKLVEMTSGSANAITVPASIFSAGHVIAFRQYGAGLTSFTAGSGFTIRSRGGLVNMAGQYAEATITFRSATEGVLAGDLA